MGFAPMVVLLAMRGVQHHAFAQSAAHSASAQTTTAEHLRAPGWWPTKPVTNVSELAGTAACSTCHTDTVKSQQQTAMARTAARGTQSGLLARPADQSFTLGRFTYRFTSTDKSTRYSVRDGVTVENERVDWLFGFGRTGQSYLSERDGGFYEARFNYFGQIHGFDRTPGRMAAAPVEMIEATGKLLSEREAAGCFKCHTTGLSSGGPLTTGGLVAGVTCEACHGPGRKHVETMQNASSFEAAEGTVLNPARFTPAASVDFCGACHFTWWDAATAGAVGIATVRFPAYRLENSRCWNRTGDVRITCVACHDPHKELETRASEYDRRCFACHGKSGERAAKQQSEKACPVARANCVSCHMPKYDLQGMHFSFTDHEIRIVRKGEAFPD